jgi:hypothetical protein
MPLQPDESCGVEPALHGYHYLYSRLSDTVYVHLRKRLYPHLLRSLWVDRWLLSGGDVSTGAFMLNDSVQTVLQRYHELRGSDHVEKAYEFNRMALKQRK